MLPHRAAGNSHAWLPRPSARGTFSAHLAHLANRLSMHNGMRSRFVDLSHTIESGMVTYKGLPAPVISDHLTREASRSIYGPDTEFQIGRIEMVSNTGTYLDTPFHRYADGVDLSGIALESIADLPGIVVRIAKSVSRAVERAHFGALEVRGRAVLVHTGWDAHWRTEQYFTGFPFLTADAAAYLRDAGAALVGIDSHNIDSTEDGTRPVHTTLLRAGIPIVEHMTNLAALPLAGFRFTAAPPKILGMGTFPVRAHARLDR
ncbi:MAG: cyclase family protein [Gemmatimonadaceae bacterium]|nr:cyclase family protein [Gemmatimonadaceae bacterium]